jgi:hypothetical protein
MMQKTHILTTILSLAMALCALPALAQDYPTAIPVSGTLTDADGKQLEGSHQLTLGFYEAKDGALPALFEQDVDVTGVLDVLIKGDVLVQAITQGKVRYLELTIDGEVMEPRIELGSVPYAIHAEHAKMADNAGNAFTLNNKPADQYLVRDQLAQFFAAILPIKVTQEGTTTTISLDACPAGSIYASTGSSWVCKLLAEYVAGDAIDIVRGAGGTLSIGVSSGGLRDDHIGPLANINPAKIKDTAAVLGGSAPQNFKANTLVINQSAVSINKPSAAAGVSLDVSGTVAAGKFRGDFEYANPSTRVLTIQGSQFMPAVGDSNGMVDAWTPHKSGYAYLADDAPSSSIALVAPIDLPNGATIKTLTCYHRVFRGELAGYVDLQRIPSTSLIPLSEGVSLATTQTSTNVVSKTRTLTSITTVSNGSNDYQLHIEWAPSLKGNASLLKSCKITYELAAP